MISQGRLWWDLNFDYWTVMNLAAGHSAEDEIELCWAPLSKCLTSVTLPGIIPGKDKTPSLQIGFLQEEQQAKNTLVLDLAMNQILGCMSITNGGFLVTNFKIPCLDDPKSCDDHKEIDKFLNKGSSLVATGREYQEYLSEYAFLMQHCVKKTNAIEFIKCMDNPKFSHCEQKPIQATPLWNSLSRLVGECSDQHQIHHIKATATHFFTKNL